jgi:putative transposase
MKRRFDHKVPDWVTTEPTFFLTVTADPRGVNHFCKSPIGTDVLESIRKYHNDQKWFCSVALLMPDHIHMIVTMSPAHELAKTVGLWKRWLARHSGIAWQENFFEHRLRDEQSEDDKGRYILANPVRAGFVEKEEDWEWVWMPG